MRCGPAAARIGCRRRGQVPLRPLCQRSRRGASPTPRAVLLLVAWVALLPTLGYVVGSLVVLRVFFVLTALLMRDHRPSLKGLALDVGVSVGVVAVLYLVFTWVLVVQLPEFVL